MRNEVQCRDVLKYEEEHMIKVQTCILLNENREIHYLEQLIYASK